MTFEEVGLYLRLLSLQWREGSIPSDPEKLARICGLDGPAMAGLMAQVGPCFEPVADDPSRLFNQRLKMVSNKAEESTRKLAEQGRAGARARWGGNGPAMPPPSYPDGPAIAKRESESDITTKDPPSPPDGGSEAPKPKSGKRKQKKSPTPPPADFKPSESDIAWFRKTIGVVSKKRVDLETQNFLTHHARKGNEFADWNQAWKNWMVREAKLGGWEEKEKGKVSTGRDGEYPETSPGLVEED